MTKKTQRVWSGPAFPFKIQVNNKAPECYYGMTLRDYFAAQSLIGRRSAGCDLSPAQAAKLAYGDADALLKVRMYGGPEL